MFGKRMRRWLYCAGPNTPAYINREAECIKTNYFCWFNPETKRFEFRYWIYSWPNYYPDIESKMLMQVDEDYRYPNHGDIVKLQIGLKNAQRAKEFTREIDEYNLAMLEASDKEDNYQHRAAAKDIWHYYREPSVFVHRGREPISINRFGRTIHKF